MIYYNQAQNCWQQLPKNQRAKGQGSEFRSWGITDSPYASSRKEKRRTFEGPRQQHHSSDAPPSDVGDWCAACWGADYFSPKASKQFKHSEYKEGNGPGFDYPAAPSEADKDEERSKGRYASTTQILSLVRLKTNPSEMRADIKSEIRDREGRMGGPSAYHPRR